MLVVSNTSPISNLAIIGRLDLLREQLNELIVPGAVADELAQHPDPNAHELIQAAFRDGWIKKEEVAPTPWLSLLLAHIHRGEAEAIALSVSKSADLVIIDEKEGRRIAVQAGLSVIGVLGVLLRAKKSGTLELIRPELDRLRMAAHFFIAPELEAKVLEAAGE